MDKHLIITPASLLSLIAFIQLSHTHRIEVTSVTLLDSVSVRNSFATEVISIQRDKRNEGNLLIQTHLRFFIWNGTSLNPYVDRAAAKVHNKCPKSFKEHETELYYGEGEFIGMESMIGSAQMSDNDVVIADVASPCLKMLERREMRLRWLVGLQDENEETRYTWQKDGLRTTATFDRITSIDSDGKDIYLIDDSSFGLLYTTLRRITKYAQSESMQVLTLFRVERPLVSFHVINTRTILLYQVTKHGVAEIKLAMDQSCKSGSELQEVKDCTSFVDEDSGNKSNNTQPPTWSSVPVSTLTGHDAYEKVLFVADDMVIRQLRYGLTIFNICSGKTKSILCDYQQDNKCQETRADAFVQFKDTLYVATVQLGNFSLYRYSMSVDLKPANFSGMSCLCNLTSHHHQSTQTQETVTAVTGTTQVSTSTGYPEKTACTTAHKKTQETTTTSQNIPLVEHHSTRTSAQKHHYSSTPRSLPIMTSSQTIPPVEHSTTQTETIATSSKKVSSSASKSSKLKPWAVVVIAVGATLVLVSGIIIVRFIYKRRISKSREFEYVDMESDHDYETIDELGYIRRSEEDFYLQDVTSSDMERDEGGL